MTTNRYRAGQPADLSHMLHRAMPVDFAGKEPAVEQPEKPVEIKPQVMFSLRDKFLGIFKKEWK